MAKKDNKQRLFEIMQRVDPQFNNEGVNLNMLYQPSEYKKKANELKAEIDKMFMDQERWEDIDTLYRLIIKRTKPVSQQEINEIFDKFEKHGHK